MSLAKGSTLVFMLAVFASACADYLTMCLESAMQIMMEQRVSSVQQKIDVWL